MKNISLKLAAIGTALILIGGGCAKDNGTLTVTEEPVGGVRAPQSTMYPITIDVGGVIPKEVTLSKGDRVEFRNSDIKPHRIASNPHPSHADYPEFDSKNEIKPGEVWTFKFEKAGTWKFHDHLNPTNKAFQGTVIVK